MTSQQIPVSILRKSCNILETLTNLLYLAEMEADDPQKVLQAMTQVLVRGE
jgi:hypothetical protein